MWHTVLPGDAQDALKASDMERLKASDVATVGSPGFCPIEERGHTHCSVDCHFGWCSQVVIFEHAGAQSTKGRGGQVDAGLDVVINMAGGCQRASEVAKLLDNLEVRTIDAEHWRWMGWRPFLHEDFSFFCVFL